MQNQPKLPRPLPSVGGNASPALKLTLRAVESEYPPRLGMENRRTNRDRSSLGARVEHMLLMIKRPLACAH